MTLITRSDLEITFTPEARALREHAMIKAVDVEAVTDADSQAIAVEAQKALAEVLKIVEDSRKAIKAPILDAGRKVDATAQEFVRNVQTEATRISRLIGDFQALERAKQQAAENARKEELSRLEREREAELAKANSFEQREAVHERFQQEVESIPRTPVAPTVQGQRVSEDFEFEVTDLHLLAKMHPDLVNIEPRRSAIREKLKLGHTVVGIQWRKVVNAAVRAPRTKELAVNAI